MTTHKLVSIIGIHAKEQFLSTTDAEADKVFDALGAAQNFVAGALFKGGHTAPLSGQEFRFVRASCRR